MRTRVGEWLEWYKVDAPAATELDRRKRCLGADEWMTWEQLDEPGPWHDHPGVLAVRKFKDSQGDFDGQWAAEVRYEPLRRSTRFIDGATFAFHARVPQESTVTTYDFLPDGPPPWLLYQGGFEGTLYHGYGKKYASNGKVSFSGRFHRGQPIGHHVKFRRNGQIAEHVFAAPTQAGPRGLCNKGFACCVHTETKEERCVREWDIWRWLRFAADCGKMRTAVGEWRPWGKVGAPAASGANQRKRCLDADEWRTWEQRGGVAGGWSPHPGVLTFRKFRRPPGSFDGEWTGEANFERLLRREHVNRTGPTPELLYRGKFKGMRRRGDPA